MIKVELPPGWLLRDVRKAAARLDEWFASSVVFDCERCREKASGDRDRMIVCIECGNKRCPKASDHRLACTRSNAPGQAGSIYE
jgi:hypothetical protein